MVHLLTGTGLVAIGGVVLVGGVAGLGGLDIPGGITMTFGRTRLWVRSRAVPGAAPAAHRRVMRSLNRVVAIAALCGWPRRNASANFFACS